MNALKDFSAIEIIRGDRVPSDLWRLISGAWHPEKTGLHFRFPLPRRLPTSIHFHCDPTALQPSDIVTLKLELRGEGMTSWFEVVPADEQSAVLMHEWEARRKTDSPSPLSIPKAEETNGENI